MMMASASLILIQPPAAAKGPSLRDIEESLQALLDCEDTITPEQAEEYYADVQAALQTTKAKRDRYNAWLVNVEQRIGATTGEIGIVTVELDRLKDRKERLERVLARGENYVLRVIQSLGEPDAKGKYPQKLEGTVVTFSAQKNPVSVDDAVDEVQLAAEYKVITVTMPLPVWDEMLDNLAFDLRSRVNGSRPKVAVSKAAIKDDLTADPPVPVPGAHLKPVSYRLVRK